MKKYYYLVITTILFLGFSGLANASLLGISNSTGHVVLDDATGSYWTWDLSRFRGLSYDSQISEIAGLNVSGNEYFGFNDWHMASYSEMNTLWSYNLEQISTTFNPSYLSGSIDDWNGRYNEVASGWYYPAHFTAGVGHTKGYGGDYWLKTSLNDYNYLYHDAYGHNRLGAWVVSNASPVPEPGTILLLGSTLIGIFGWKKIKQ